MYVQPLNVSFEVIKLVQEPLTFPQLVVELPELVYFIQRLRVDAVDPGRVLQTWSPVAMEIELLYELVVHL